MSNLISKVEKFDFEFWSFGGFGVVEDSPNEHISHTKIFTKTNVVCAHRIHTT